MELTEFLRHRQAFEYRQQAIRMLLTGLSLQDVDPEAATGFYAGGSCQMPRALKILGISIEPSDHPRKLGDLLRTLRTASEDALADKGVLTVNASFYEAALLVSELNPELAAPDAEGYPEVISADIVDVEKTCSSEQERTQWERFRDWLSHEHEQSNQRVMSTASDYDEMIEWLVAATTVILQKQEQLLEQLPELRAHMVLLAKAV